MSGMTKLELVDTLIESEEENRELTERLRVACETIEQLKRVNKEWEALWKPIDDLVRPLTPLGESVGDKAVGLINEAIGSLSPEFEDGVEFEGWELRSGEATIIEDARHD